MPRNSLLRFVRRRKTAAVLTAAAILGAVAIGGTTAVNAAHAAVLPGNVVVDETPLASARLQVRAALDTAQTALTDAAAAASDVQKSGLNLGAAKPAVDTAGLQNAYDSLVKSGTAERDALRPVAVDLAGYAERVESQVAALRTSLNNAAAQYEAEVAQQQAAAAAQAAADALAAANTPDGARATARQMAADLYGWGSDQFQCLNSLWNKESSWNYQAHNSSGATGIPQSLPGGKMSSAGGDWATNAATQIRWGLGYINSVYGTPCSAWGHSQATNWY
ncbi:phospholipase [Microbacterium capsulatum]|uniref:Phospholipase n=1 Tax=Microbacterium capsulatum TaxID=3041921 RepID=A0ABU0XKE3_9MICO|nr:phospholipase [Microbacterium sp. ASV81]MDQ4215287.1 phospholipase [Microbacterium sp. ASV81]